MWRMILIFLIVVSVGCELQAYPDKDFYSSGEINAGEYWFRVNIYGDDTVVDMYANAWVHDVITHDESTFNVYGGLLEGILDLRGHSVANIHGGILESVMVRYGSTLNLFGTDHDGLTYRLWSIGGSINLYATEVVYIPQGGAPGCDLLQGKYIATQTQFSWNIFDDTYQHITIISKLPETITVDDDGPADFNTIQAAIDYASDRDKVVVADGTYTGFGNLNIDFLGKAITVQSKNGPKNCIIDIGGSLYDEHYGFNFHEGENKTSIVDGFTVENAYGYYSGGFYCLNSSPTIRNCIITNNVATWGGAISCRDNSNPVIHNCLIFGNEGWDGGGALYCQDGSSPTISNCIISNNWASYGSSVAYCTVNCSLKITNSIIWGNDELEGPIIIAWYSNVEIAYSDVQGGWDGEGNINADPCFVEPNGLLIDGDYHLLPNSPCIDAGDNNSVASDRSDCDGDMKTSEPFPFDFDGEPRIFDGDNDGNAVVDMGPYEFRPSVDCNMWLVPRSLNLKSKGKWLKAHIVLPGGYSVVDVDANRPCELIEPFEPDVGSEYMNVFINEEGLVEVEAWFMRSIFCSTGSFDGTVTVAGRLKNGLQFVGTDIIKVVDRSFEGLSVLAGYWLVENCESSDWCDGLDLDQDGVVNFKDFVLLEGCCIEVE